MAEDDLPVDLLWREYGEAFRSFDDLSLARWLAQTLGQLQGRAWRHSHPLVAAYRLAAQLGHDRQVWLKRLATVPHDYPEAPCCRAPLLPLLTRDILESGFICQHCGGTAVPFDEIPNVHQGALRDWATAYAPIHAVAHWEEHQQRRVGNYDQAYEDAAEKAEQLLAELGFELTPKLLDYYPTLIWEDQDECLEVLPQDIPV